MLRWYQFCQASMLDRPKNAPAAIGAVSAFEPQPGRAVHGVAQQGRGDDREQGERDGRPEGQRDRASDQPGQRHQGVEAELDAHRRGHVAGEPRVAQVNDLVRQPPQTPDVRSVSRVAGSFPQPGRRAWPGDHDPDDQVRNEQCEMPQRRPVGQRGPAGAVRSPRAGCRNLPGAGRARARRRAPGRAGVAASPITSGLIAGAGGPGGARVRPAARPSAGSLRPRLPRISMCPARPSGPAPARHRG